MYRLTKLSDGFMSLVAGNLNIENERVFEIMREMATLNNIPLEWICDNIDEFTKMFNKLLFETNKDYIDIYKRNFTSIK